MLFGSSAVVPVRGGQTRSFAPGGFPGAFRPGVVSHAVPFRRLCGCFSSMGQGTPVRPRFLNMRPLGPKPDLAARPVGGL